MEQDRAADALSAREKQVLRLLLAGHDAKSSARDLGLSVHTINEHLREARRKLGVSSSREAARRLAEAEQDAPDSLGTKQFGVVDTAPAMPIASPSDRRPGAAQAFAWLGGGMLIMSLLIATLALSLSLHAGNAVPEPVPAPVPVATIGAQDPVAVAAARTWIALVDQQEWGESWDAAGTLFKTQLTRADWAKTLRGVREPLGAAGSRIFQSGTHATTLPGVPVGDYEILQFQTRFASRPESTETIALAREGADWKVIGYFIR